MRIRLFQIDSKKDPLRRMFCSLRLFEQAQGFTGVDMSIYDSVLNCDVDTDDLEEVFQILNADDRPLGRTIRSMSCSDVILTKDGAFYCDTIGFKKVEIFYLAKQKCNACGKEFVIRYNSDGTYNYLPFYNKDVSERLLRYYQDAEICDCESGFSPVEGVLTIDEWLKKIDIDSDLNRFGFRIL